MQQVPVRCDLVDHLPVERVDGGARRGQVRCARRYAAGVKLPLREAAVLDRLGRVDLVGENRRDVGRVDAVGVRIGGHRREDPIDPRRILDVALCLPLDGRRGIRGQQPLRRRVDQLVQRVSVIRTGARRSLRHRHGKRCRQGHHCETSGTHTTVSQLRRAVWRVANAGSSLDAASERSTVSTGTAIEDGRKPWATKTPARRTPSHTRIRATTPNGRASSPRSLSPTSRPGRRPRKWPRLTTTTARRLCFPVLIGPSPAPPSTTGSTTRAIRNTATKPSTPRAGRTAGLRARAGLPVEATATGAAATVAAIGTGGVN